MDGAFTVLLLGGSSGTGKTRVSMELAHHLSAPCSQVDDFRLVMQRSTTVKEHPDLHFFLSTDNVWQRAPEELFQRLRRVGEIVSRSIEVVVANHVATSAPLVLEGDGILPGMAAQKSFAGLEAADQVRAVFLFELDEEVIGRNMLERGRGFTHYSAKEQNTQVRMNWLYGQWLRQEAERHGLPVVSSRPWDTLLRRVLEAIECS